MFHTPSQAGLICCGLLVLSSCAALTPGAEGSPGRFTGPWDLKSLRQPPKFTFAGRGSVLSSLYYENEPYQGKPARVFAYYACPEKVEGKIPAMVLVHGGGGTAFAKWAQLWAERGYAALAMDLAGHGPDGHRLPDGGPEQDESCKFKSSHLKDFWTYHAVAAVIRGVSLLARMPEVDPKRIGITGISWGGYLTCIVAGLDDRLKVAVPVYGCGFIHENSVWLSVFQQMSEDERRVWVENFEPSRYLGQARMPVLFINGTNDFAYPLDSYRKSYRLVRRHALCVTVNMPHSHEDGWAPVEIGLFADQYLRGGAPLARIRSVERKGSHVKVNFTSALPVERAALHYTTDTNEWNQRQWETVEAAIEGSTVKAGLPEDRPLVYFLTLTDSRKATVSTEHEVIE